MSTSWPLNSHWSQPPSFFTLSTWSCHLVTSLLSHRLTLSPSCTWTACCLSHCTSLSLWFSYSFLSSLLSSALLSPLGPSGPLPHFYPMALHLLNLHLFLVLISLLIFLEFLILHRALYYPLVLLVHQLQDILDLL